MSPKVFVQYVLPHRLLSRIAYGVARTRIGWFKDWLIQLVVRKFNVDMAEAADPVATNYLHCCPVRITSYACIRASRMCANNCSPPICSWTRHWSNRHIDSN